MDISLELKGLPCLNKVYLLTYLLSCFSFYLYLALERLYEKYITNVPHNIVAAGRRTISEHFLRWLTNPIRERQTWLQPIEIYSDAAGTETATLFALFMSASSFSFHSPAQSA